MIIETADSRQQTADSRQQTADSRQQTADSRCHYFDFLRVAGAFAVMLIHVATLEFFTTDVHTFEWQVFNSLSSIVRWAVPVFTMISGALFLSKDIPIRKIYGKYILRIFTALVFWSFVYACANYATNGDIVGALKLFVNGQFHLWFLSSIIVLYMSQPFLKKVAESESLTKYFLVLAFVFMFLLPEAAKIITLFSDKYGSFAGGVIERFRPGIVTGLAGYFILGYFLNNARISPRVERIIYALGILGFLWGLSLSSTAAIITGKANGGFDDGGFYAHISLCRLLEAVAVFVFFKSKFNRPSRIIRILSKYTFGAYLVHIAVISVINILGLNPLTFSPVFSIPVISVIVCVFSFGISAVLNHIPVLKKYIV